MKRLHAMGLTQIELDPDAPSALVPTDTVGCEKCGWRGFFVDEIPLGQPYVHQGRRPCPACKGPEIAAKQMALVFGNAGIPSEYERTTFDSFRLLPIYEPTYEWEGRMVDGTQPDALEACIAFAAEDRGSLMIYGQQKGAGKTALAIGVQREIVTRTHCSTLFITTIDLLDRIRATFSTQSPISEDEVLSAVRSTELLVLDEIGRERKKTGAAGDWVVDRLFSIINWRYTHQLRTVYTSNQTIAELSDCLDDATAWRIKDHVDKWYVKCEGLNIRDMTRAEREAVMI